MKKICSLLLSVAILATMVFCPTAGIFASAETQTSTSGNVVIENTFDEGWNPLANSNLVKQEKDGSNGNALQFNNVTSISATTGNAIRHYKIFNPQKVYGGFIDYKPASDTTYKLTFRYRTRSLTSYNIFINVRGVSNDTVGEVLCRAVTVKKTLGLTTNNDYKWDTAVAYFTTPADALDALAISVEYNSAADSTGAFNVTIDDVKLETAPSNFVLANTFEEDNVNTDTLNRGTDVTIFLNKDGKVNESAYTYNNTTTPDASTLRTNSTLGFRAVRTKTNSKKVHFEIYDYSKGLDENGKLKSFVPENGSNYRITFDYKVLGHASNNILYTIRPVTVDESGNRTFGDAIAAIDIPKNDENHSTCIWRTAEVNVPITNEYDGLAFTIETDASAGFTKYTTVDNVVVHKYDENVIINDYDQIALGSASSNEANMANTKITGNNLYHLGTKLAAKPNASRVLQFRRITGQTDIAAGNYTYAEIYNPYDTDFAGFTPKANTYYKLSFDYKVKHHDVATINFNIRGKSGSNLGDIITTAATVTKDDATFADYAWGHAEVLINTAEKNYDTFAISIELEAETTTPNIYPYLDNIMLEEIDDQGDTCFTVYHNSEIYGKLKDVLTENNLTSFSDITFEDTETAKFEGLYLDSDYETPATGIINGATIVYAKWKDISKFVNTYDASGVSLAKLQGEGITFWGKRDDVAQSNVIQFNNVYGQKNIKDGKIVHVELYNPNDRNFTVGEKLPSFNPSINSVYKISFDFRIKASESTNIFFNIRGKKDGQFGDVLGTAAVLESGDPAYSNYAWNNAEVYIYTEGVDYDSIALTIESDGDNNANLWPYIDNIGVEVVKEYKSGVIGTIAPATGNTNGLIAIEDGKWFEVTENDDVKVTFKLNTATAIADSRVVANIIDDNGDVTEVSLFDFSEESGEKTYITTFKAPTAGKVAVSVYKNDYSIVNQEVVLSDLAIGTHTPSILKGDVNLDGIINAIDVVVLKKASAFKYAIAGDYLINADLSKDGVINAGDVVANRKQIMGDLIDSQELGIDANYTFANETEGSAEGTITLTSTETTNNIVEIYWGANDKPLDTYYFIGTTEVKAGQSVNLELASHLAIPEGATQIIVSDGLTSKSFDFAKRYDASFVPDKIGLVKDYTVNKNESNVKVVCASDLTGETYDLICEFRNKLSDILGADVELLSDYSNLDENQNYIVVGSTRLSDSATLLDSIKNARTDYHGDFAIKAVGRKIYINACNDYALQFAFDYFFDTYCANGVTDIQNDIDYLSSDELKTITLADIDINEYRIVYPETATVLEVDAANYLAANIVKATGKAPMSIVNDATAELDYEILIGHTNRTDADYAITADSAADNSYTITVEENRTIITGGTNSAVNAGVIDFTSKLMAGSLAVGIYEGKYDGSFSLTNGFKLTWADEFNGTSLSKTWQTPIDVNYSTKDGGTVVWDNENNVKVENGTLIATAGKVAGSNDTTGVALDTSYNKRVKYGYFEARIKSFDQAGYMNAFWASTTGENANFIDGKPGTYYGEFDILEMYETPNEIRPNLHNHCVGEATSKNYLQGENGTKPYVTVEDIGSKFHNFAMEWTDDYIYFYLDGVKYYSFDCSSLPEYEVFDMVARIRLTFSAGKYITPTADSDEAFVDWVRVWQKSDAGYVIK